MKFRNQTSSRSKSAPIRLFRCKACGHKMRFGANRCGWCLKPTEIRNRKITYLIIAFGFIYLCITTLMYVQR